MSTVTTCPYCGVAAQLVSRSSRYRRGERVLSVETQTWECPSGCEGPEGERPFQFETPELMRENDVLARAAWRGRYGEDLPPAMRPGRKPAEQRDVRVQILLTRSEEQMLDALRGATSRSEFFRRQLRSTRAGKGRRAHTE